MGADAANARCTNDRLCPCRWQLLEHAGGRLPDGFVGVHASILFQCSVERLGKSRMELCGRQPAKLVIFKTPALAKFSELLYSPRPSPNRASGDIARSWVVCAADSPPCSAAGPLGGTHEIQSLVSACNITPL